MWAKILNILFGLWIMASPALMGFEKTIADYNHITGPLIITFTVTALWEINRNARWMNIPIALTLAIATMILQPAMSFVFISNVATSLLIILLCFIKQKRTTTYGGGWRSLFQDHPSHISAADSP